MSAVLEEHEFQLWKEFSLKRSLAFLYKKYTNARTELTLFLKKNCSKRRRFSIRSLTEEIKYADLKKN